MKHLETRTIHDGRINDTTFNSVMPPLYPSSNFAFDRIGVHRGFDYTRSGNPTRQALESCLSSLEGGVGAVCTATGMAAVTAVLHLLKPGDHVVAGHDIYGGTWRLMHDIFSQLGIRFTFAELHDTAQLEPALCSQTRMIWMETPSNPMLKLTDIAAIAEIARQRNILTVVDNTFLSPCFQQPIALGADIVVHSTTKYINGHSDVVGGAVISANAEQHERITFLSNALGITESPFDAWLVLRGVRTLPQRMIAHAQGALRLSSWLKTHPKVKAVHYPGLPEHPQAELAQRQMSGAGGVLTFELDTNQEGLDRVFAALRLFVLAESLGGVESLIEAPWYMSHLSMSEEARTRAGIHPGTVRVSVGLEHSDDLMADLDTALGRL